MGKWVLMSYDESYVGALHLVAVYINGMKRTTLSLLSCNCNKNGKV
jgi:hypothetical protein